MNQCPADSYAFSYRDGGLGCVKCSAKLNLAVNSNRNGCTCQTGYANNNGTCAQVAQVVPINNQNTSSNANIIPDRATTSGYDPNPIPSRNTSVVDQTNSYVPAVISPTAPTTNNSNAAPTDEVKAYTQEDCSKFPNTYWTNIRCACKPGYKINQASGTCMRIGLIIVETDPVVDVVCDNNSYYNGSVCTCKEGYYRRTADNKCVSTFVCP